MKGQRKQIFSVSVRVCENIHQRDLCDCECELLPPMKIAQNSNLEISKITPPHNF
jgi:hypothetical protein